MENNENNQENPDNKAAANQQQHDLDFLDKAEKTRPDTNKAFENGEARLGDVHPTERVDTSQEEANANAQSQSDDSNA
jgi:hypothetical protein